MMLALLIVSVAGLSLLNYLFFFSEKPFAYNKPPPKRPPVHRGYRITTFGTNPNRTSSILNQTPEDERAVLNAANEKAFKTISQKTILSPWQRELAFLGVSNQQQRLLLAIFLLFISFVFASLLVFPVRARLGGLTFFTALIGAWLVVWTICLLMVRNAARFGLTYIDKSAPFSFILAWSAVRATSNVPEGIDSTARIVRSLNVNLPILMTLKEVVNRCRGDVTLDKATGMTPSVRLYANTSTFCNALFNFQRGISVTKSIEDLKNLYKKKRKVQNKFHQKWSLNSHIEPIASWCQCRGIPLLLPLSLFYTASAILLGLTIGLVHDLYILVIPAGLLFLFASGVTRSLAWNEERHLRFIIRPFLNRVKQGAPPEQALSDVRNFADSKSKFYRTICSLEHVTQGEKEVLFIVQQAIKSSNSPLVQRFWVAFACAVTLKMNLQDVLEELILDMRYEAKNNRE